MRSSTTLRWLVAAALGALLVPLAAVPSGAASRSEQVRTSFMRAFERPRVPLDVKVVATVPQDLVVQEQLTVASEAGVRVPVLLVRPAAAGKPRGAIVCLHGLGGSKEGMRGYLQEFARRGFVAVALDARYHGDRKGDVQAAMAAAYKSGKEHPYLWDTVWDTWRVLDYLETRADVDKNRLGVMGISLGGHTTWMVSADPRVKVAVPCISVCSWKWQLAHEGYKKRVSNLSVAFDAVRNDLGEATVTPKVVAAAWHKWLPGIPDKWDCQDILGAMAPRPLLILNGETDDVAPIEGVHEAFGDISKAYQEAGASDHLKLIVAEKSGHTVTVPQQAAMYEWFERWLR